MRCNWNLDAGINMRYMLTFEFADGKDVSFVFDVFKNFAQGYISSVFRARYSNCFNDLEVRETLERRNKTNVQLYHMPDPYATESTGMRGVFCQNVTTIVTRSDRALLS